MARIGKFDAVIRGTLVIAFLTAIVVIVAHLADAFGVIANWSREQEEWQAGGPLPTNLSPAFALAVFAWHRSADLPGRLDERRRAEEARRASE